MSDVRFAIRPSTNLQGAVKIQGAKNSVLKLMAATLLAEGEHRLENVPNISDVKIMAEILRSMGCVIKFEKDGVLVIKTPPKDEINPFARYELVEKMRASIVVLGPLLGRCGQAEISTPGGDDFGHRPIDYHLDGLSCMGVSFEQKHGYVSGTAKRLQGARITLEFPSHTATDNLLMAAVLADGCTVIENAAREPEIIDLASMLCEMGAKINGAGTSRIEIEGVESLQPADHEVIPDRLDAATFIAAVAIAGGDVFLKGARSTHMETLLRKVRVMGVVAEGEHGGLRVRCDQRLKSLDVATLPYPGVATDYKPLVVTMLSVAAGVSIVTENIFAGRFRYIDELKRLGADISTEGHHVVVRGLLRLSGAPVRAPDVRAGAALVVAGLVADGETEIFAIEHIQRGYEDLPLRLRSLGVDISERSGD